MVDNSVHFNRILELDVENRRVVVEPGIVLDELNRALKPHGLTFPVDVSTASRATIGGMAANNKLRRPLHRATARCATMSCDRRVAGRRRLARFGPSRIRAISTRPSRATRSACCGWARENAAEIDARIPDLMRRVGGYNIDALVPSAATENNLAHLLVGSEGTLAYHTQIRAEALARVGQRVLGVCHFPASTPAMDATQHLVGLDPTAVELVDPP